MSDILIEESTLQSIASAIRSKNGLATTYKVSEMAQAINAIPACVGITADDIALRTISGSISGNASFIGSFAFRNNQNLTTASFPSCTSIGSYAFYGCSNLTTASFLSCTGIGNSAFYGCSALTATSFPSCTSIGSYAFQYCYPLTTASFLFCTHIGSSAFYGCSNLTTASFPVCTSIGNSAFYRCYHLLSLYLTSVSQVPTLGTNVFSSTPIVGYTTSTGGVYGSVFVPSSLYASFLTATNWSLISSRIVSV